MLLSDNTTTTTDNHCCRPNLFVKRLQIILVVNLKTDRVEPRPRVSLSVTIH